MEKKLIDKLFCFNEDEFYLLASSCGIKNLRGFEMQNIDKHGFDEEQIKQTIISLCKKNVIYTVDDRFRVVKEIKKIFKLIKDARLVISIEYMDGIQSPVCIYLNDESIAYMRPATNGVDYVGLGLECETSLSRFLTDSGFFPEEKITNGLDILLESDEDIIQVPSQSIEMLSNRLLQIVITDTHSKYNIINAAILRSENGMIGVIDGFDNRRMIKKYNRKKFIDNICIECYELI